MRGTDFAVISWDMPSGSVFDGFAYDFPFLNETLKELGTVPQSVRFESLEPNSNYTVMLYVFSRHVDGSLLYSEPIAFNFSTCVWLGLSSQLFFWGVFLLLFLSSSFFGFSLVSFGQASRSFQFTFLGWDFLCCYFYVLFVCLFVPLQCFPSFGLDNLGQASGSFELMCFGLSLVLFLASFEKHNWY